MPLDCRFIWVSARAASAVEGIDESVAWTAREKSVEGGVIDRGVRDEDTARTAESEDARGSGIGAMMRGQLESALDAV